MFKANFSGHNKIWGGIKKFGAIVPECLLPRGWVLIAWIPVSNKATQVLRNFITSSVTQPVCTVNLL